MGTRPNVTIETTTGGTVDMDEFIKAHTTVADDGTIHIDSEAVKALKGVFVRIKVEEDTPHLEGEL